MLRRSLSVLLTLLSILLLHCLPAAAAAYAARNGIPTQAPVVIDWLLD